MNEYHIIFIILDRYLEDLPFSGEKFDAIFDVMLLCSD